MMNRGFANLHDITEEAILSFFISNEGNTRNTCYKGKIITVFKVGGAWNDECRKILPFLPKRHVTYNNIPHLTDREVNQIRNAIDSDEKGLCLRDKAIIMLLLYTGLRACDIASLKLESVDWEKEIIRVCQRKTDTPLELPLSAIVGNAIFAYLTNERPTSNDGHVFLRAVQPYTSLSDTSISVSVDKVCRIIGIRQAKGERRGTHIFRHKAATAMLENNVSRPVISTILGHTSPVSVDAYLHAGFQHLKECALSIREFPIAKGVLGE